MQSTIRIIIFWAVYCVATISSLAQVISVDGVYYEILNEYTYSGYVSVHSKFGYAKYTGEVSIPDKIVYNNKVFNVTSIEQGCFRDCIELYSISLPTSIEYIPNSCFSGCIGLSQIVLPSSIKGIGEYAFRNCTSLQTCVLPSGLNLIEQNAFENCQQLKKITLPGYLSGGIAGKAFKDCLNLRSIVLPSGLRGMGYDIFIGCKNIQEVYCYGNEPYFSEVSIFEPEVMNTATLFVLTNNINTFANTKGWSSFENIVGLEDILVHEIVVEEMRVNIRIDDSFKLSPLLLPYQIRDKEITYISRNQNVAMIEPDGLVTGISMGSTEIVLSCENTETIINVSVTSDNSGISQISQPSDHISI